MECRPHATGTLSAAPASGEYASSAAREGPGVACSHHREAGQGMFLTLLSHPQDNSWQYINSIITSGHCDDPELFAVRLIRFQTSGRCCQILRCDLVSVRSIKSRLNSLLESKLSDLKPRVRPKSHFMGRSLKSPAEAITQSIEDRFIFFFLFQNPIIGRIVEPNSVSRAENKKKKKKKKKESDKESSLEQLLNNRQ